MFLRWLLPFLLITPLLAQVDGKLEIDFMSSYYDQDGENSPVNGGVGSEELTSASPIIAVRYTLGSWNLSGTFGLDNVTSASIDAMDDNAPAGFNVSSASRKDNRGFAQLSAGRAWAGSNWNFNLGFSKEYDYKSINAGLGWSRSFNQNNTTLSAALHHYMDDIDVYNIHGVETGTDERETTDLSITLSQVLSSRTQGSIELFWSDQSGLLSSPFQEVIFNDGSRAAERLPDARTRTGAKLSLNHAWRPNLIHRNGLRVYDDDFGVQAITIEQELHFKLSSKRETWVYPIFRYHQQDGSDYFGLPQTFDPGAPWYTADRDLSEFDSMRYGLGAQIALNGRRFKNLDVRLTYYDRDDGLTAFNLSFGLRWSL